MINIDLLFAETLRRRANANVHKTINHDRIDTARAASVKLEVTARVLNTS